MPDALPGHSLSTLSTSSDFSYQLGSGGHRGTSAIKRLVEYAPASGGLALWMQHRDVEKIPDNALLTNADQRQKPWIIGNDGSTLYYGIDFINKPLNEQTGLVAHQVLHVALRHVDREQQLRERLGNIDSELFALCADAIVNSSLSHLSWLDLPKGSIMLDTLLLHVLGIEQSVDVSLHEWDTETLYRAIDDRDSRQGSSRSTNGRSGATASAAASATASAAAGAAAGAGTETDSSGEKNDSASHQNATSASDGKSRSEKTQHLGESATDNTELVYTDGPKATSARQLAKTIIRDLIPNSSNSPESRAENSTQWQERLTRAHAADEEQSFMRQLLADNTIATTPWEQVLRTRLQRALCLKPETNWSRPTRSWIANKGRTSTGHRMPWEPGTSYSRSAPRLCVMVDVSGSVDNQLMQRFANEIDRMVRTFGTDAQLIIGDDQVRAQHRLKSGVSTLRSVEFNGGGATNFVPLINAADKFNPDIAVFLTDLEGPAGDPPYWPLIWAVPAKARVQPVPFGQRIIMD